MGQIVNMTHFWLRYDTLDLSPSTPRYSTMAADSRLLLCRVLWEIKGFIDIIIQQTGSTCPRLCLNLSGITINGNFGEFGDYFTAHFSEFEE